VLAAWAFVPRRADPRLHGTLALASGLGFTFGTLGTLVALALREVGLRSRLGGAGWYALLFPTSSVTRRDRLERDARHRNRRARLELRGEVAPLADVLARGKTVDRIQIVSFLARNFRPRYADALRRALGDPDPAIRAQAAGVAAGVERRLADTLQERHHAYEAAPDDPDRIRALAELYDDFAHTGLLSAAVARSYREEAITLYRRLLGLDAEDERARMRLVRLLLRIRRPVDALRLVDEMPGEIEDLTSWFSWLSEAYYRTGRYADLRRLCTRADREISVQDVPVSVREAIKVWSEVPRGTPT
jgi:tetratricopeptide (TPR) repeat protein